ncbi:MAG: porin [Cyclobacteriaceae bacterium]
MKTLKLLSLILLISGLFHSSAIGQNQESAESIPFNFFYKKGRGFGLVTKDSIFSINYQFRIQSRATFNSISDSDLGLQSAEMRVRRLRMKFEGFVYDPRLTYYIQLSFSRGDMDFRGIENSAINNSPNVVRDAVIYYALTKNIKLGFGQTKLPGNRQRVISSGDQQFIDRSIVNATFNIDRDFGFFGQYSGKFMNLRGALTSGEGRNSNLSPNSGLAYTGRVEFLPLGRFTGNNDYVEGDLARESRPKLSIGLTASQNNNAVRQSGQLGNDLFESRTLNSMEADILFKFNGISWYSEYMERNTSNPITINPSNPSSLRTVFAGSGYMSQLSYLFKNNIEVGARYATTKPEKALYENVSFPQLNERKTETKELVVTKYLVGHRLKIQGGIMYTRLSGLVAPFNESDYWSGSFQMELGI